MSNCFSCGKSFTNDVNGMLQMFKRQFLEQGIERYFYKTSEKGDVKVVKKAYFSTIFETEIKPNFRFGAEYAHIKEYNETTSL